MNVNTLTTNQKAFITQCVDKGLDLNALQKAITNELGLPLTYMETRFLILDLGLTLHSTQPHTEAQGITLEQPASVAQSLPNQGLHDSNLEEPSPTSLQLTLNETFEPGQVCSGRAEFPSGCKATWFLDNQYRIGIDPDENSLDPTEEDMTLFEREIKPFLRNQLGQL